MVLGIYYMTRSREYVKGEGMIFSDPDEVRSAYDAEAVDLHAGIKVRMKEGMVDTTTGRILLYEIIPDGISFDLINKVINKRDSQSDRLQLQAYRGKNNGYTGGPIEGSWI